jgi:hypothetical protein
MLAQPAIHRLPHRVVVRKGEAGVHNACDRHKGRQDRSGKIEELHTAVADLREQIGVRSQLVGGEELDIQASAGRLANAVDGFLIANVDRVCRVLAGGELVAELGGRARARDQRDERQCRPGGEQSTTADAVESLHSSFLRYRLSGPYQVPLGEQQLRMTWLSSAALNFHFPWPERDDRRCNHRRSESRSKTKSLEP